jgi:Sec-independent protein translocase protein TatA
MIIVLILFGKLPSLFNDIVIGFKKIKATIDQVENEKSLKLKNPRKNKDNNLED